jgi:hypothetical protein
MSLYIHTYILTLHYIDMFYIVQLKLIIHIHNTDFHPIHNTSRENMLAEFSTKIHSQTTGTE